MVSNAKKRSAPENNSSSHNKLVHPNPVAFFSVWGVLACLYAPLFFLRGFGVFDDSLFLKFGEMIASGALPYRDFFDNKPPGVFYVSALIHLIGVGHWLAPRFFLFFFALGFAFLFRRFVARLEGERAAQWGTLIFWCSYSLAQGYSLHTDQLCAFFTFLSVVALFSRLPDSRKWWIHGALLGVAFLFKQTAIAGALSTGMFLLFEHWRSRWPMRICLARVASAAGGGAAVLAVAFALLQTGGVAREAFEAVFLEGLSAFQKPLPFSEYVKLQGLNVGFVLFLGLALIAARERKNIKWSSDRFGLYFLLLLNGGFGLLMNLKVGAAQGHYVQSSAWVFCLLSALLLQRLVSVANRPKVASAASGFVAAVLFATTVVALTIGVKFVRERRLVFDLAQRQEIREILGGYSEPGAPVLSLSPRPAALYYMSGHPPASKYLFYWWDERFSLGDALGRLTRGEVPLALVELPLSNDLVVGKSTLKRRDLQGLSHLYSIMPLKHPIHPVHGTELFALVLKNGEKGARR